MDVTLFNVPPNQKYKMGYFHVDGWLNPGGGIPTLVDEDGNQYPLLEGLGLKTVSLSDKDLYEKASDAGDSIGDENPFSHSYVKADLSWSVLDSRTVFYSDEWDQGDAHWKMISLLPLDINPTKAVIPVASLRDDTLFTLGVTSSLKIHQDWGGRYYEVDNTLTLQHIDDTHYIGITSYRSGVYNNDGTPQWESKGTGTRGIGFTGGNYSTSGLPSFQVNYLQKRVSDMLVTLYYEGLRLYDQHPERFWDASLSAADGVKAYDLNMVEALMSFSLEDLIPKKASANTVKLLESVIDSGSSFAVKMLNSLKIMGSFYLYQKYVVGTNLDDLGQLTGIGSKLSLICDGLQRDNVSAPDYNWQLMKVAQRIVYAKDYIISTYGGVSYDLIYGSGDAKMRGNAKLLAIPGALYDASAAGIIVDEFGLKLSALRLSEAIPWEFVANWFLPIEKTIHSLEDNADVLNQRYNVISLTLSTKVDIAYDMKMLKALYGLSEVRGSVRGVFYERFVIDHFPKTVLSFSSNHGGINMSRLLQGGALLITK